MQTNFVGAWLQSLAIPMLLFFSLSVNAETAWVTDVLQLSLTTSTDASGSVIGKLPSGTRVEVLETVGLYSRVKTSAGASGWVKALYLMDQEPAAARLKQVEKENKKLQGQAQELQQQMESNRMDQETLNTERNLQTTQMQQELVDVEELRQRVVRQDEILSQGSLNISMLWLVMMLLLAGVAGLLTGFWLFDWRSRTGGYRVV
jgi:SH3 domain protein